MNFNEYFLEGKQKTRKIEALGNRLFYGTKYSIYFERQFLRKRNG